MLMGLRSTEYTWTCMQKCAYSVYWEGHGMDEGGKDGGCVEGCDWPGEAVVWIRLA
jgi:hypothetical protein